MISNIVHVTKIPRKKVLKWFEDKRGEDGVPDHRLPYQRFASETVLTPYIHHVHLENWFSMLFIFIGFDRVKN